jgi:POT family proton-dependent oligopeptide transporter
MAKRKIEPNTVVKFGLGFCSLPADFMFSTTQILRQRPRDYLAWYFYLWMVCDYLRGTLLIAHWNVCHDQTFAAKIASSHDGNVVFASAYGQYFAGLLGANIAEASQNASNIDKLIVYADGYKQLAIYAR